MLAKKLHPWQVTRQEAMEIQGHLRSQVIMADDFGEIRTVAGVDIGIKRGGESGEYAKAAVVVLSYPELETIDQSYLEQPLKFPYIPGLLSFRESPSIISAFENLNVEPDLIFADGQGIAHPRGFGIASHLGLLLDKPTIGCAKSRLYGRHKEPNMAAGSIEYLYDKGEIIGATVRTRANVKYVYISIGHKISLKSAVEYTLNCCQNFRLPQPTRLAHQVAGGAILISRNEREGEQLTLF